MPELRVLHVKIENEKNQAVEKEKIVEYQNLSTKVQDLASRVEKYAEGQEIDGKWADKIEE